MGDGLIERARIIAAISAHVHVNDGQTIIDGASAADEIMTKPVMWACKTCNAPRPGTTDCWKCGGVLKKPADGWEWPGLPDIERIRKLAGEVGYALGVHGSLERDLDIIAAPWVTEAVSPLALAEHIAAGLGGRVVDHETQDKPCGRWSCNIHTPTWTKMIDLSVMPAIDTPSRIAELEAENERLRGEIEGWKETAHALTRQGGPDHG